MRTDGKPFVDSRFYSTVSVIRTMETLLGLPPMNNNDALSSLISTLFTGPGDQPAYSADYVNRDNGLLYTANKKTAPGAAESMKMDFRHADRAPAEKLNIDPLEGRNGQSVSSTLSDREAQEKAWG